MMSRQHLTGEPDAPKGARPVRSGGEIVRLRSVSYSTWDGESQALFGCYHGCSPGFEVSTRFAGLSPCLLTIIH
jgi:hypothetical protein